MSSTTSSNVTVTADCTRFCEPTQSCISAASICDKYQNCPNDIDEINCTCDVNHYPCQNGRCIYKSWLCDGVRDCPLGDDESPPQCSVCNSTQFTCRKPHLCLSLNHRCDGSSDCVDSSDESNCLNGTSAPGNFSPSLVSATYKGVSSYYICSNNWNGTWSDAICKHLGYAKYSQMSFVNVSGSFLEMNLSASSSNLMAYLQISNCSSRQAVAVSCIKFECGSRSVSLDSVGPYILNGQRAKRGAWPWQTIVQQGTFSGDSFSSVSVCGGTLINDEWVLTAAHCAWAADSSLGNGNVRPENILITLGTISRTSNADSRNWRVSKVIVHGLYNASSKPPDYDLSLMRLSGKVNITDTVRPICLPSSTEDLSRFKVCVSTGFGRTILNDLSNDLLQARMNILSYNECYDYLRNSYIVRDETQMCVGTIPTEGDINFCKGDSGGPLSCQDQNGIWKIAGVSSYVIGTSGTAVKLCELSVAVRVTRFLDWIQQTISSNSV